MYSTDLAYITVLSLLDSLGLHGKYMENGHVYYM